MEAYRKYFSAATLEQLIAAGPNWGVNVHTVGHHIHSAHKPYPDQSHPQPYVFDWEKGRRLQEFQLVYIARGQGLYQCDGGAEQLIGAGTLLLHFPGV